MVPVNLWAVLVSGVAAMVVGFLWYGPLLGKQWVASMGWSEAEVQERMKKGAMWGYVVMFIGALVMAYILGHSIAFTTMHSAFSGPMIGAWIGFGCWLGFIAPSSLSGVMFEQKSWKWWFIFNGYYLVTLIVMGIILAIRM